MTGKKIKENAEDWVRTIQDKRTSDLSSYDDNLVTSLVQDRTALIDADKKRRRNCHILI